MRKKFMNVDRAIPKLKATLTDRSCASGNIGSEMEENEEPPPASAAAACPDIESCFSHFILPVSQPVSPTPERLLRKHFRATVRQWNDWQWQLKNRVRTLETLSKIIQLSEDEKAAFSRLDGKIPLSITPYYASLLDKTHPGHPLRRAVVPVTAELSKSPGESADPLGEDEDSPVPGLVHRYPNRVLFLVTHFCSTYCRYCTRSRVVGKSTDLESHPDRWEKAIEYIKNTPVIRDVLISGGDPLTLSDEALEWILSRLRQIPHVEIIRIGTKVPVVLPQRITPKLIRVLRKYHPLWINIHFMHPEELTPETSLACIRLADAGIPLGSQTVLLKGVNDEVETLRKLVHGLLKIRVRPYYLYQCDPIEGSAHFRTSVQKGLEIISGLRGHTTGFAVPTYVIDAPGGGGKIPLMPKYVVDQEGNDIVLKNYENQLFRYPDVFGCSADGDAGVK